MTTDYTRQVLVLPDGRKLGYAEWGDLNGQPVFFFAGSNSARLARYPDDSLLSEHHIHLYTFDRPGMGLSTRQPGRGLLDWANDIRNFASQKNISYFSIIAASQGGPYGVACAYALSDVLTSVTLVSAVSPLDDPAVMATQTGLIRLNIWLARHAPRLLALQYNAMRPMLKGDRPKRLFSSLLKNLPPSDQQVMSTSRMLDMMLEDMRESMQRGGAGAADDMHACVTDWGFKLEDIQTKVFLWQGEADPNVTPAMGHYLASHIPNCAATFVSGAGHFLIYTHWRDILFQMIAYQPTVS